MHFLALHDESFKQALQYDPPRNLWKEAMSGRHDIIGCAPERINTPAFKSMLESSIFKNKLGFCVIDEAHLIIPWSWSFQEAYQSIGTLQALVPSNTTFLAMSGSMDPKIGWPKTQNMLGFQPGRFHDVSLPIDRQDLIYGARILKHSIHGTEFPNLMWLVPNNLAGPESIHPTLIAVNTIAIANALVKWLHTQLKAFITPERGLVLQPAQARVGAGHGGTPLGMTRSVARTSAGAGRR